MPEQQVVLITGAAQGIGRHIARTFALQGDSLALADVNSLDLVASEMGELGVDVEAIHVDVRQESSVKDMVDATIARYGRIDTLVNNAGIVTHFSWAPSVAPRSRPRPLLLEQRDGDQSYRHLPLHQARSPPHGATEFPVTSSASMEAPTRNRWASGPAPTACPRRPSASSQASWL